MSWSPGNRVLTGVLSVLLVILIVVVTSAIDARSGQDSPPREPR
jgi:hypothetical protein